MLPVQCEDRLTLGDVFRIFAIFGDSTGVEAVLVIGFNKKKIKKLYNVSNK
jgi:hypothetical protein